MVKDQPYNSCSFCNAPLTTLGSCLVCEKCKTVANHKGISQEKIISNAKDTIASIQNYLDKKEACLSEIEQKQINSQNLPGQEIEICEYCGEFLDCKVWLETFIESNMNVTNKNFREKLYQLLTLSHKFKDLFNEECTEFTMN